MSSETAASSAPPPKRADGEGESEAQPPSQSDRPQSSGGVGEPSEPSPAPGGESEASEPASGEVESEEACAPEKLSRQKMRPELDGLTESLTLRILEELDFRSLAAVKRVCRHLSRIAHDPSLFRRVSRVEWRSFETRGGVVCRSIGSCSQLGGMELPAGGAREFLGILEGLLEGGASLVSLHTPMHRSGGVLEGLTALLAKRQVRLEALAYARPQFGSPPQIPIRLRPVLLELLRSQPGLVHLCVGACMSGHPFEEGSQGLAFLPSLRHLSLRVGVFRVEFAQLEKLAPQLRSLVFDWVSVEDIRAVLIQAPWLLFQAVGKVGESFGWRDEQGTPEHVAFAVEGFQREERGRPFLHNGKPWDPWDEAKNPIPQPTNDWDIVRRFLAAQSEHTPFGQRVRERLGLSL